jgi:hypothetical protein
MLHRTGKRSGTIHAMNQISPKLAQIKHSVIPIPGVDGQVVLFFKRFYFVNIYLFNSLLQFIVLDKLFKFYQQKLDQKN